MLSITTYVNGASSRFFSMDRWLIFSDNNVCILGNMPTNFRDPAAMFSIFNSKIQASMLKFNNSAFSIASNHANGALFQIFCMDWGLIFSDNNVYILGQMPTNFRDPAAMFSIFNSKIQASMLKFNNSAFSYCKQPCEWPPLPIFLHGLGVDISGYHCLNGKSVG